MELKDNRFERIYPTAFLVLNQMVLFMWRLGLGKLLNIWPAGLGRIMVINHRGRSSGKDYYIPVNYAEDNGSIYCTSITAADSDWCLNLQANPHIEVWMPEGWFTAKAEVLDDDPDKLIHLREVLNQTGFAAPLLGMYPKAMPDNELAPKIKNVHLVRIQRQSPQTGRDGPGGLAWVWPFIVTILLLKKKKRHR